MTPNNPFCTLPNSIISSNTFRATLLGTANEYPTKPPVTLVIAVFIPIKSPLVLTRAPPLFPELTAASV